MSKPVIFDDISKKAKDILSDDYFSGTKMTMKIKHVKGINITTEAKTATGKPVISKISTDFVPCDHCNIKKLSIESTGSIVADADVTNLFDNTTFTIRTLKNYNESGMVKAALGLKVLTDSIAFDAAMDPISKKYNVGFVYAYKDAMLGLKTSGVCSGERSTDVALSYKYNRLLLTCTGYKLFSKTNVAMYYELNEDTRLSAVCKVDSFDKMPAMEVGVSSSIAENTTVRAKVNGEGEISGCFKTTVNKKMTFSGAMTLDAKNLNNGNHKVGFGVEFLFYIVCYQILSMIAHIWEEEWNSDNSI